MSYLYRTGNGRNNIAYTNTANSSTKYLRRLGSGRTNINWYTIPQGSTYNILQRNGTGRNNILWSNLKIASPGEPQYSSDISAADTINLIDSSLTIIMVNLRIPMMGPGTRGVYLRATPDHNNTTVDARSCIVAPGSYSSSGSRDVYLSRGSTDDRRMTGNFSHIFNEANKLTLRNKSDGCWITVHLINPTQTYSYKRITWEDSDKSQVMTNISGASSSSYAMYNYLHDRDGQPFDLYFNKEY